MASETTPRAQSLAALQALGYTRAPKATILTRGRSQSLEQIVHTAPSLAQLSQRAQEGQARLKALASLLPASLRQSVQSGGMEDGDWCLLAPHNAAAAKLRQMLPALAAHLRSKGFHVTAIKVKVLQK